MNNEIRIIAGPGEDGLGRGRRGRPHGGPAGGGADASPGREAGPRPVPPGD